MGKFVCRSPTCPHAIILSISGILGRKVYYLVHTEIYFKSDIYLSIVIRVFLDSIVRQMNILIWTIFEWKFFTRCSQISLFIPVASHHSIQACQKHVAPEIKFPLLVQERFVQIFLDNKCIWFGIRVNLFARYDSIYLHINIYYILQGIANNYPHSSVGEFTWFNNPYVPHFFLRTIMVYKNTNSNDPSWSCSLIYYCRSR